MKNVIFTYDSRVKGEEGETCMNILMDDDRAAAIKDELCAACEALRGRKYLRNSIKCVKIEEA